MKKQKPAPRNGSDYWGPLIAEFETAPCRHGVFAARHGLRVGTFRQWLYRLRGENPRGPRVPTPRFVEMVASKPEVGCTLVANGFELRFEQLPAPEYLAEILSRAAR